MKKKEIELSPDSSNAVAEKSPVTASNSMVDIVVRIKQEETFANLKVSSFDLILSLEYLLKIAQFVTIPDESKPAAASSTTATSTTTVAKRTLTYFQI